MSICILCILPNVCMHKLLLFVRLIKMQAGSCEMAFFHFSQLTLRAFLSRGFIIEHLSMRINDLIRRCAVIFGRVRMRVRLVLRIRRFKRPINGRQGGEFTVTKSLSVLLTTQLFSISGNFVLLSWTRVHAGDSI